MDLEDRMEEAPEAVFFKYAYPCGNDLLQLGIITPDDFAILEGYKKSGIVPQRSVLEKLYPNAFERIDRVANSIGKERWNSKTIREYFLREHNQVIERGEGLYEGAGHTIKDLCQVKTGKIIRKDPRKDVLVYDVEYGGRIEPVVGNDVPNARVGDKISTHWGFAVETLSEELYGKYHND